MSERRLAVNRLRERLPVSAAAIDRFVARHGAPIIDPVWTLLARAYRNFGVRPTLVERDFNFPPLAELIGEVRTIRSIQSRHDVEARDVRRA